MNSRTRGYLPHLSVHEGTYFVTFRLADSLPADVVSRWQQELRLKGNAKPFLYEYQKKIEHYLDQSYGDCSLRRPEIAAIIDGALRYFDHQRYELLAWTIMPNHVHVLFQLLSGFDISSIVHSWKSFSAHQVNRILNRSGTFWQREYFDTVIMTMRQLEFTLRYILRNPVHAGLCKEVSQWPWTGCSEEMQAVARRFFL